MLSPFPLIQPCRMDREDGDGTGGRIPSCNYWSGCGSSRRHQRVTWVVTRGGGKSVAISEEFCWGSEMARSIDNTAFKSTALHSTASPKWILNGHWPLGRPGNHIQILTCNRFLSLNVRGSASGPDGSLGALPCSDTAPRGQRLHLSSRFGRAVEESAKLGICFQGNKLSLFVKESAMLWAGPPGEVLFWILCGRRHGFVASLALQKASLSRSENHTQECTLPRSCSSSGRLTSPGRRECRHNTQNLVTCQQEGPMANVTSEV